MTVLTRDGVAIDVPQEVVADYIEQGFCYPGQASEAAQGARKPRTRKGASAAADPASEAAQGARKPRTRKGASAAADPAAPDEEPGNPPVSED